MLNINEVNEAILELEENCPTTYNNCIKLAALYTVRDCYKSKSKNGYQEQQYREIKENDDIIQENGFLDIKK